MDQSKKLIRMTITLGIITLVAMVFSFLAINDIVHGEEDITLEMAILRVTALFVVMFIALTFATFWRMSREFRKTKNTRQSGTAAVDQ